MNRKEILEQYEVNEHGIICSPGKFEGEMLYAPYFYDMILDGGADETEYYDGEDGPPTDTFILTDEDKKEFPELKEYTKIECYESEQGFFYTHLI